MADGIVADVHGGAAVKYDGCRRGVAICDGFEVGVVHQHKT